MAKVGSLFGSGKLKELEANNRTLQGEVAARDESIKLLQQQMQRQQEEHNRQLTRRSVIPEINHPESQEVVPAVPRVGVHGEVLPQNRLQRKTNCHAYKRQADFLRGRTLFGGT